ncbi:MAG: 4-hydroxy-3-methylbut-2-enyl diphosphate reductase [Nitrospirae bacterium]|nr:4-hydroxy-3-methylbut-2-enyl diphosphate reductase [Nitrospirota bacterium]
MQIIVAEKAGFCFGVKRAIDITFDLAKDSEEGIYTLGPLIHNAQVVDKLADEGVKVADNIHSSDIKTLVIRTHGIPPKIYEETSEMGYKVVDATCPFVKKAQQNAKKLKEEGYQVIIIGDREHPEVQSLLGFAGDDAVVLKGNEDIPPLKRKVGIIVQTTKPISVLRKVMSEIVGSVSEIKVYNTICDSTSLRLEETSELAREVDVMIIVGGKHSANTNQLVNLAKELCSRVYFIETAEEIGDDWVSNADKVGVTGGASTPRWIIDEVVERLKEIAKRR